LQNHQCTPKFFKNPPVHPGEPPTIGIHDATENDVKLWTRKANKFAEFYLTLFRPEPLLYSESQHYCYSYKWEDLENFVSFLKANIATAINRFRLDQMTNMIHCLHSTCRSRTILSDYRARDASQWSEEEINENMKRYTAYIQHAEVGQFFLITVQEMLLNGRRKKLTKT
jgi:hypothetical protein